LFAFSFWDTSLSSKPWILLLVGPGKEGKREGEILTARKLGAETVKLLS
jgi:hypothetical protein